MAKLIKSNKCFEEGVSKDKLIKKILYSGESFSANIEFNESIDNYMFVIIIAADINVNAIGSIILPAEQAKGFNIPITVTNSDTNISVNGVISETGNAMNYIYSRVLSGHDTSGYIKAVYGFIKKESEEE